MKHNKLYQRIMTLLICVVMLATMATPVMAENTTQKVAFYPLAGFFEYDAQGNETGYGVELLDRITQYSGIHFTYVAADSWESTRQMLSDGVADIRMPVTLPAAPSATRSYTQHSVLDTYYAVLALKDRTDLIYDDFDKFPTLKYAITNGTYHNATVQPSIPAMGIPESNLVFYDGYNECRAALDTGEVDAVITNIMDLDDETKTIARFSLVSNYIGTMADNPNLEAINNAISRIKLEDPTFLSSLYSKWFPQRAVIPLTKEETKYLATLDHLSFSFREGQGYLSRKETDGTFAGFYPALAQLVSDKLGIACNQNGTTNDTSNGPLIYPDFYYDYSWAQECQVDITQPFFTVNYYELSRKGSSIDPSTRQVAAMEAFRVTRDYIGGGISPEQMIWCDDYAQCIEKVYEGTADIAFVNSFIAEYYLNLYRYSNLNAALTGYSHKACFGIYGDESGMLASILGKVLSSITEEDMNSLMVECTTQKPEQNLLTEWIYENPTRSIITVSFFVALLVILLALCFFVQKTRKQNAVLQKATNVKQDFLSRMSHDMRTPMNAIIGFSGFGIESQTLEESRAYHQKISESGQYLLRLINDTLDLNKMESGNFELHPEPYNNTAFIQTITNILQTKADEKGVIFTIDSPFENPPSLLFDKMRLQQIFVNLLNNAIKFTPMGGHVTLKIAAQLEENNKVTTVFSVIDDGIGMTEAFQREKLYKPFVQEHRVESVESGTGLGLSIVKELVCAMGGTITCHSTPGKGTTFTVTLTSEIVDEDTAPKDTSHSAKIDLAGKRVLICEDHHLNREIANKLLHNVGVLTENAANGQLGVSLFEKSPEGYYDAILMDIRMPIMDGLAAAHAIRELTRSDAKTIPIIAMTANAFEEDTEKSLHMGMNVHLAKPIVPQLLYQTLQEQIAQAQK